MSDTKPTDVQAAPSTPMTAPPGGVGTAVIDAAEQKRRDKFKGTDLEAFVDYDEDEPVTVLYGYGRVDADYHQLVDNTEFVGGIARNVPFGVALHWKRNTRPDGKRTYGRVNVYVLTSSATEADFMRITGMRAIPDRELAAQINARDVDDLVNLIGQDKLAQIAAWHATRQAQRAGAPGAGKR